MGTINFSAIFKHFPPTNRFLADVSNPESWQKRITSNEIEEKCANLQNYPDNEGTELSKKSYLLKIIRKTQRD